MATTKQFLRIWSQKTASLLRLFFFNADYWYEIDTIDDLLAAGQVCSLYERPSARLSDYELNDQIDPAFLQAAIRLPVIAKNKKVTRWSPNKNVPVSVMPALPSTVPQPI